MMMHEDATGNCQHSGHASGPLPDVSVAPAEFLQQVAMLKLAPQADGTLTSAAHPADDLYLYACQVMLSMA